jgi:hypothetical protein
MRSSTGTTLLRMMFSPLVLLAIAPAWAGEVVVPPLLSSGVESQTVHNLTTLIASELDFMPEVDKVIELDTRPSNLGTNCLASTSCLAGITRNNGGNQLIGGIVKAKGEDFEFDLLLYDSTANKIVRRKSFTINSNPTAIANGMTPIIIEVLTGVGAEEKAAAAINEDAFSFDDGEDDFDMIPEEVESARLAEASERAAVEEARRLEEARIRAEEQARIRAEEEASRRAAEEARRLEEERRRAEEAARQRAEEAARQRAAEEARERAEAEAANRRAEEEAAKARAAEPLTEMNDFDPSLISFGEAADEIKAEDIDALIQFGAPPPPVNDDNFLYDDEELASLEQLDLGSDGSDIVDLDGPTGRQKPERTKSNEKTVRPRPDKSDSKYRATLKLRTGYVKYYSFNFIANGAEIGIPLGKTGVYILAGVNAYAVNRKIPPKFQPEVGKASEWNLIYPLNLGVIYKFTTAKVVQPYLGADGIGVQYFKDAVGTDWAVGGRGRVGVDFMVANNVGLNIDVSVGYWAGRTFTLIQEGVANSGVLPGVSGGLVIAF